jgi:hypothetical protein
LAFHHLSSCRAVDTSIGKARMVRVLIPRKQKPRDAGTWKRRGTQRQGEAAMGSDERSDETKGECRRRPLTWPCVPAHMELADTPSVLEHQLVVESGLKKTDNSMLKTSQHMLKTEKPRTIHESVIRRAVIDLQVQHYRLDIGHRQISNQSAAKWDGVSLEETSFTS